MTEGHGRADGQSISDLPALANGVTSAPLRICVVPRLYGTDKVRFGNIRTVGRRNPKKA
jgi:hypothetical protein